MEMTLNELIGAVRIIAKRHDGEENPPQVFFSFCRAFPTKSVGSSRCYYERAAIDWASQNRRGDNTEEPMTIGEFLTVIEGIPGMPLHGYKGGQYTAKGTDPLHVDGYGECTSTVICDVHDKGWAVVLETRQD